MQWCRRSDWFDNQSIVKRWQCQHRKSDLAWHFYVLDWRYRSYFYSEKQCSTSNTEHFRGYKHDRVSFFEVSFFLLDTNQLLLLFVTLSICIYAQKFVSRNNPHWNRGKDSQQLLLDQQYLLTFWLLILFVVFGGNVGFWARIRRWHRWICHHWKSLTS